MNTNKESATLDGDKLQDDAYKRAATEEQVIINLDMVPGSSSFKEIGGSVTVESTPNLMKNTGEFNLMVPP
jgi:hypothetical protein